MITNIKYNMETTALAHGVSETSVARSVLAPYCEGVGLDIGYVGDPIVPSAITMDMPTPYTSVGGNRQILRGDCRDLSFICDGALDYIYSSHLLEDFTYYEFWKILIGWRRVLRVGGRIITNCPDQQRFLKHCAATGQGINGNHKEQDFSLENFKKILFKTGSWEVVFEEPDAPPYSWYLVVGVI